MVIKINYYCPLKKIVIIVEALDIYIIDKIIIIFFFWL